MQHWNCSAISAFVALGLHIALCLLMQLLTPCIAGPPPSAQGHVLGLGTIWDIRGCESGCKPNSPAGTMNYYK